VSQTFSTVYWGPKTVKNVGKANEKGHGGAPGVKNYKFEGFLVIFWPFLRCLQIAHNVSIGILGIISDNLAPIE